MTSTSPPHEDFFLVRISSLTKRKTHCSPPPPPRHSQEDFSLVRISSLTKRKTHGCPKKLPRVFLFVKEEILTGLISLWVGEREGIWGFPLWQSKKPNWNLKRISPPPSHKDFFLVRIFSLAKRKTHWSPPSPPHPPSYKDFPSWGFIPWRKEKLIAVLGSCH